jgi:5-methylcytosine-specific restriction endonuclease McrA
MLKRDSSARFVKSGAWIFSRYRLQVPGGVAPRSLNEAIFRRLRREQEEMPVALVQDEGMRRQWWLFRDEFYWEDEGYDATAVKALILEREAQRERRVRRAVALMEQTESLSEAARQPIPDEVKAFVWNRDGGRCVRCGSRDRLEFDHVIPLALGGSNTARNLQILCEACNRTKGASVV